MLDKVKNRFLWKAYHGYHCKVLESRRRMQIGKRVVERWSKQALLRAFTRWAGMVIKTAVLRKMAGRAIQKWMKAVLRRAFVPWSGLTRGKKRLWHAGRCLVEKRWNRLLRQYFAAWNFELFLLPLDIDMITRLADHLSMDEKLQIALLHERAKHNRELTLAMQSAEDKWNLRLVGEVDRHQQELKFYVEALSIAEVELREEGASRLSMEEIFRTSSQRTGISPPGVELTDGTGRETESEGRQAPPRAAQAEIETLKDENKRLRQTLLEQQDARQSLSHLFSALQFKMEEAAAASESGSNFRTQTSESDSNFNSVPAVSAEADRSDSPSDPLRTPSEAASVPHSGGLSDVALGFISTDPGPGFPSGLVLHREFTY